MTPKILKYVNQKRWANKLTSLFNHYFLPKFEFLIGPDSNKPLRHPPIFILGAPRSGSTLAVQAITEALDIAYISNLHCKWYGAPAIAQCLFRPDKIRCKPNFCSVHGRTQGAYAPAECGEWWYRFFRRTPTYVSLSEVDSKKMHSFRRSIASLIDAFDRPILFKNLYASLRIQPIAYYLPESLFIVMHRNEINTGHSILEARHHATGKYSNWWSMEPSGNNQLRHLPVHQQVIEQIRTVNDIINKDLAFSKVTPLRRLDLEYEKLCADPNKAIKAIQNFLQKNNCKVKKKNKLPCKFPARRNIRIKKSIYRAMKKYAETKTR